MTESAVIESAVAELAKTEAATVEAATIEPVESPAVAAVASVAESVSAVSTESVPAPADAASVVIESSTEPRRLPNLRQPISRQPSLRYSCLRQFKKLRQPQMHQRRFAKRRHTRPLLRFCRGSRIHNDRSATLSRQQVYRAARGGARTRSRVGCRLAKLEADTRIAGKPSARVARLRSPSRRGSGKRDSGR